MGERPGGLDVALDVPGFDDAVGQVAAGGDEEGAAAHGDVGHPQGEQVGRRAQHPLARVEGVERAGPVDEGFEGVADDLLGERAGGVVGAGGCPPGGGGDVAAAGGSDVAVDLGRRSGPAARGLRAGRRRRRGPACRPATVVGGTVWPSQRAAALRRAGGGLLLPDVGGRGPLLEVVDGIEGLGEADEGDALLALLVRSLMTGSVAVRTSSSRSPS